MNTKFNWPVSFAGFKNLVNVLGPLVAIVVTIIFLGYVAVEYERTANIKAVKLENKVIFNDLVSGLELQNIQIQKGDDNPRSGSYSVPHKHQLFYYVTGRVINNSTKYNLNRFQLKVSAVECSSKESDAKCITIGEGVTSSAYGAQVPSGQARDIKYDLFFNYEKYVDTYFSATNLSWHTEIIPISN